MKRISTLVVGIAICSSLAITAAAQKGSKPAQKVSQGILTITNTPSNALSDDGRGPYKDYVLNETDNCVATAFGNTGGVTISLNRRNNDDTYCWAQHPDRYTTFEPRTWTFTFPVTGNTDACDVGVLHGVSSTNPDGTTSTTSCRLTVPATPTDWTRVRLDGLFVRKPTTTPVEFIIPTAEGNYALQADFSAPITFVSTDGNTQTVTYTKTATLYKVANSDRIKVSDPFPFPFQVTVERVYQ